MVVDPDRRVLGALGSDAGSALGPLLASHAAVQFGGSVVTVSTGVRAKVAEALAEVALLRSELRDGLASGFGLVPAAAGLHPWSEASGPPTLMPLQARPTTRVAEILGRFEPTCGLRIAVAVPDAGAAVRALDGLRLQVPLILALAANSPFWRGRYTGLASTRTALRLRRSYGGLPRGFGTYAAYVTAIDALANAGAIPSPGAVHWDLRLRPDIGALEVTVMDSQSRVGDLAGLAALIQCLVRFHAERGHPSPGEIPELVLENRLAAMEKGMRADLIDPGGHFTQPASDELALVVEACAPVARELDCSRALASVRRMATDPGHARQRSITAERGLSGLVDELVRDFDDAPTLAVRARA
jgi:carboxylate-amine ligase